MGGSQIASVGRCGMTGLPVRFLSVFVFFVTFTDAYRDIAAMYDFAAAQDTWSATWPSSADDRAFRM